MFDPISRSRVILPQLITKRKVGRPDRDRARHTSELQDEDAKPDFSGVEVVLYAMGVNGAKITRYMPKGQYVDTYA